MIIQHYNTERVLADFGIRIIGVLETWAVPTGDYEYGDAYAVGTDHPYEIYLYTRADATHDEDYWLNIGPIAIQGPRGPVGPRGLSGERGEKGDKGDTGATGKTGPQGPRGERGEIGPQGETGQQGPAGVPGNAFRIIGIITDPNTELADPSTLPRDYAYLFTENEIQYIYFIAGVEPNLSWQRIPFENATQITVGGEPVELFNADTKVDKVSNAYKLYATDSSGNQTAITYGTGISANLIVQRGAGGQFAAPEPTNELHVANKKYVDDGFVAKNTETSKGLRCYAVSNKGNQIMKNCTDQLNRYDAGNMVSLIGITLGDTAPTAGSGGLGTVVVPMCQKDYQAAPKRYVDLLASYRYVLSGGAITSIETGSIVHEGRALLKDGSKALVVVNGDPITFDSFVSCAGITYVVNDGVATSYTGNISQIECNPDQVVVITSSPIKAVNPSKI